MKIVFVTEQAERASSLFYAESFRQLAECGCEVRSATKFNDTDYTWADVVLFMGYDPQPVRAKSVNPRIRVGVVDPRPSQRDGFRDVDFLVLNGIEAQDFFCRFVPRTVVYFTFPLLAPVARDPQPRDTLILGYHGNRVHLEAMMPRITDAIAALATKRPIEFWAMYNVAALGRWTRGDSLPFPVKHIQFSAEAYGEHISQVDIGVVPQFIPVREGAWRRRIIASALSRFNEEQDDFLHRFKVTTNIGRHWVFAQYGIPVVSDITPSAAVYLRHPDEVYLASSTAAWATGLDGLAQSAEHRATMGRALRARYEAIAHPRVQNRRLADFLGTLT